MAVEATSSGSAFAAQVDALLATGDAGRLAATAVLIEPESVGNTVLDSGSDAQVLLDRSVNAFRVTTGFGS